MITNRTIVKVESTENSLAFSTISRSSSSRYRKFKSCRFFVLRAEIKRFFETGYLVSADIYSFAVFRKKLLAGNIEVMEIGFSWLSDNGGGNLIGSREIVLIPYEGITRFCREGEPDSEWKVLSMEEPRTPHIIFNSRNNLKLAVANPLVRRRLSKFMRNNLHWVYYEKVEIIDDFAPYSFIFTSYTPYGKSICGGIILHNRENLATSYYGMHT